MSRRVVVTAMAMRIVVVMGVGVVRGLMAARLVVSLGVISVVIASVVMIMVSVAIVMGLLVKGERRRRGRQGSLRLGFAEGQGGRALGRA